MRKVNTLTEKQIKLIINMVKKANYRIKVLKEKELLGYSDSYQELKNYVVRETQNWDIGYLDRDGVLVISTTTHRLNDAAVMNKIAIINKFLLSQDSNYKVCEYKAAYKNELNIGGDY